MNAPRYTIQTAADFLNVPVDRRAACLSEFLVWLTLVEQVNAGGMIDMATAKFVWTDDGREEATAFITLPDGTREKIGTFKINGENS